MFPLGGGAAKWLTAGTRVVDDDDEEDTGLPSHTWVGKPVLVPRCRLPHMGVGSGERGPSLGRIDSCMSWAVGYWEVVKRGIPLAAGVAELAIREEVWVSARPLVGAREPAPLPGSRP